MQETMVIDVIEYDKLLKDSYRLMQLELGGVDNWEGYEEAINRRY